MRLKPPHVASGLSSRTDAALAHSFSLISIREKDESHASLMHLHLKIKVRFELLSVAYIETDKTFRSSLGNFRCVY